ncbi:replication-relaxation family protein [Stackebrandtia nassauensis]|uniref:Replication-relaxation n=1 Tax=Stackebrandtia nassauensis (strain DSM 44728 / CIP 108903 / NRRL B-16338 / NBRC 102104 / LLR-40K-21) TaxID=446470 RepID=D3Q517_STANL|nr:replication-relaxation family protein [Stackebrandtia nassauensis]ADD44066.1 hypothetical protein Snas_4420 [Stackebrandtia nassauensis DSM 44728]
MTSWRKRSKPVAGLEELAGRLQERDRLIIDALGRYKVLTKAQVARLFFDSESSARDRLSTLVELDVITRYRSHNRQAWRYTLAYWGACVHAVATNPDAKTPTKKAVFDQATRIMHSAHRGHTESTNDFFTRLTACCRHRADEGWVVERWLSSAESSLFFTNTKPRPDGGATIHMDDRVLEFWFEHDTGTEPLHVLADKIDAYDKEYDQPWRDNFTPVLLQIDKPGRETHFHHTLALARAERPLSFPVATTITELATDPADAVWWLVGHDEVRVRLDQIPPAKKRLDSLEFMKYCRSDDYRVGGWT